MLACCNALLEARGVKGALVRQGRACRHSLDRRDARPKLLKAETQAHFFICETGELVGQGSVLGLLVSSDQRHICLRK